MNLYSEIKKDNRIKYGTNYEKVLNIIINQYSDRTHFIYEILQNAEDACATYIKFDLHKEFLEIRHNGRPFNTSDIQGVCGIADGTKDDGTRIGHFGIGFKSVYCYTDKPCIYSGDYCFKIVNQLFPEEIEKRDDVLHDETCMILPFDKAEVTSQVAYKEINHALKNKITSESIIMLNSIENIKINVEDDPDSIEIDKKKYSLQDDNVYSLSLHSTTKNSFNKTKIVEIDTDYLYFTDAEKDATSVVFRVEGKELKEIKHSKIYAFFPTAKEAHQKFYIHAPFDTTPARDNFKEGAEYGRHNIELVDRIGDLIWFAFTWMRDKGYLTAKGLNSVFPVYEYEHGDIFYNIYEKAVDIIGEEYIIPTNVPGEFKKIKDICIPSRENLLDVFGDEDVRTLTGKNNISWISKEFLSDSFKDVRTFLNDNFSVTKYEWKDLVNRFDNRYLEKKSIKWLEKLFNRIDKICTNDDVYYQKFIDVRKIPFIRTAKGRQICARDKDNNLLVYLNNPDIAEYRIDSECLNSTIIKRFYEDILKVPNYDINQQAIEKVLPKYDKPLNIAVNRAVVKENIADLKIIEKALNVNLDLIEELRNKYLVTDGKSWYRPSEIYIPSQDKRLGYSLLRGIKELKFLSNMYFDDTVMGIKPDENFYRKIGCNYGLKIKRASILEYREYVKRYLGSSEAKALNVKIFSKNYTSAKIEWDIFFDGFPDVFKQMSISRSINICKFLNSVVNQFDIQGEIVGADDKNYSGRNVESAEIYSVIGMMLAHEKWIYTNDSDEPYSPLEISKTAIRADYKVAPRLIDLLPFKEENNALMDYINELYDNKADADMVKRCLENPENLYKMAQAFAKNEARANAKEKKSIRDLIESADRKQKEINDRQDDIEVRPISEKALEKRQEKLEEEFAASLDNFVYVQKNLRFTARECNKEERMFLEEEYGGVCQICGEHILKYNSEPYYEAVKIIKASNAPDILRDSRKYGWDSLCLCPNCAARYKHSSKRISDLYDQVMSIDVELDSDDTIDINIELPEGEKRQIRYSPRHFLALKEAFKIFADIK